MKTIRLEGVVGYDILAADIAREIKGEDSIKLVINSGGGDVTEGFSIYNALSDFSGNIEVHVDFAGSIASVFIMAADNIVMRENSSVMMIHRPWGVNGGNSEDLRRTADTLDKMEDMLINIYMSRSSVDRDRLSSMLDAETWLSAEEAKEIGLIDRVESGGGDMALVAMAAMKAHQSVNFDCGKFLAKIENMKLKPSESKGLLAKASTLADIEKVIRGEFKLSQTQATAIVSSVKRIVRGERERDEIKDIFNKFTIG